MPKTSLHSYPLDFIGLFCGTEWSLPSFAVGRDCSCLQASCSEEPFGIDPCLKLEAIIQSIQLHVRKYPYSPSSPDRDFHWHLVTPLWIPNCAHSRKRSCSKGCTYVHGRTTQCRVQCYVRLRPLGLSANPLCSSRILATIVTLTLRNVYNVSPA